jgi:aryl-alcohol dehydrogenase-like predicted oxidoreductase
MHYTQLGEGGPQVSRIAFGNWSAAADVQLSPEEMAQIDLLVKGEVAVGGPAPEAMPRS